jgi:antitoxin VapB
MGLNIKNEETHRLVAQLARMTGETMTEAVTEAVRERISRLQRSRGKSMAERLLEIGADCAAHLRGRARTVNHADLLYDDKGLPK